jgi:hypothetical protein
MSAGGSGMLPPVEEKWALANALGCCTRKLADAWRVTANGICSWCLRVMTARSASDYASDDSDEGR